MADPDSMAEAAIICMRNWEWRVFDHDTMDYWDRPIEISWAVNKLAMEGIYQPHNAVLRLLKEGRLLAKADFVWRKYEAGHHYQFEGQFADISQTRWQQLSDALADEWQRLENLDSYTPVLEKLGLGECDACRWDALAGRFSLASCPSETSTWQSGYFEEWLSVWDIRLLLPESECEQELDLRPEPEPVALLASSAASSKGRGGAPRKWEWDGALLHLAALAHSHPDGLHPPDGAELNASDIARHLRDWFIERTGSEPVDSQLREYGARFLDALDAIKLKAANNPDKLT